MSTYRKVRSLRLTEEDKAIVERLKTHYGIASENEVVRMALRAAQREMDYSQTADKEHRAQPTT